MTERSLVRLAVIGDVHLHWGDVDRSYFDDSDYEALLFVGDLGNYRHEQTLRLARQIASLKKPSYVVPGNHDAMLMPQLLAELARSPFAARLVGGGQPRLLRELRAALSPAQLCGYSVHELPEAALSIVAARPHSMGGSYLAFAPLLRERFGVRTMAESAHLLRQLVDRAQHERVIFLAHNGPSGLGADAGAIWGCDFKDGAGDFGDDDLRQAVDHARRQGRQVLAVVAGHMHHRLRGGGVRRWRERCNDILYLNAARVPRIFRQRRRRLHHHLRLTVAGGDASAEAVLVPAP